MGTVQPTDPLETFFREGGVAVVMQPISVTRDAKDDPMSFVASRTASINQGRVRKAASPKAPDLIISSPDGAARGTVRERGWPKPVLAAELAIPPYTREEGWAIRQACVDLGMVPLRTYQRHSPLVRDVLGGWAERMSEAIGRCLRAHTVQGGRIIICGGGPFTGLIASHLVPKAIRASGTDWTRMVLDARVGENAGFIVSCEGERATHKIKPLILGPPPVPRGATTNLHAPGSLATVIKLPPRAVTTNLPVPGKKE